MIHSNSEYFLKLKESFKCDYHGKNVGNVVVMEYFDHMDPLDYIFKMSYVQTKYYFRALMKAIRRVHALGLVHRDIKFENFLCRIDFDNVSNSRYKLIDFGLASNKNTLMRREHSIRTRLNNRALAMLRERYSRKDLNYKLTNAYVKCIRCKT